MGRVTAVIGRSLWIRSYGVEPVDQELLGGASGYGVRASGYGVGASGYGSLVIIVSVQSKELGFWVF